MNSQFKTLIVFSHAAMIVLLMISLFWVSNSLPGLRHSTPVSVQEQNFLINPSLNWP